MQRILVIDDDDGIRDTLTEVLSAEGFEVETAANGLDALHRLERDPLPDLLLLDLMMPVMSGWELRMRQMESPRLMRIPVVVLSASKQLDTPGALLAVQGMLQKPLSLDALLEAIQRHAARGSAGEG